MQPDVHLEIALDLKLRSKSPPSALTPILKTQIAVSSRHGIHKLHYPCGKTDIVFGLFPIKPRWDVGSCATTEQTTHRGKKWFTLTFSNCYNFYTLTYKEQLTLQIA